MYILSTPDPKLEILIPKLLTYVLSPSSSGKTHPNLGTVSSQTNHISPFPRSQVTDEYIVNSSDASHGSAMAEELLNFQFSFCLDQGVQTTRLTTLKAGAAGRHP